MTIADNYTPIRQIGDGSTTQFSASWSMIAAAYATVFLEDATTGVQTAVTQGAGANQYQIAITASGFTVTFGTAPTASQYAVIGRTVTKDQSTPYKTSRGFQGPVEEASFDKLTALVQQLSNQAGRNISAPLGDTANLQLPKAALRANSYLTFDASGNVTVASGLASVTVSTAMTPVVGSSTVSAALALMGGASLASPTGTGTATWPNISATTSLKLNGSPVFDKIINQSFSSSGTYTPTAGMVFCIIECWGAGGGGGGVASCGANTAGAGGGGSGGYSRSYASAATIGASQTVTIGALGAGGVAGNNAGSAGGTTSVGSICIANGGSGGGGGPTGVGGVAGAGATAGTGNIIASVGVPGGCGIGAGNGNAGGTGGFGGSAPLVGGGGAGFMTQGGVVAGFAATGNGSGGGGAANYQTASTAAGGAGTRGYVVITEILSA